MSRRILALCAVLLAAVLATACGGSHNNAAIARTPCPAVGHGFMGACNPQHRFGLPRGAPGGIQGVDISNNNGFASFSELRRNGIQFVYAKAEEICSTDSELVTNVRQAAALRMPIGLYDFTRPGRISPASDAACLARLAREALARHARMLPVAWDVESFGEGLSGAGVCRWLHQAEDALARDLPGVKQGVYGSVGTYPGCAANGTEQWPASWGASFAPTLPGYFGAPYNWQWFGPRFASGHLAGMDRDRGRADILRLTWGVPVPFHPRDLEARRRTLRRVLLAYGCRRRVKEHVKLGPRCRRWFREGRAVNRRLALRRITGKTSTVGSVWRGASAARPHFLDSTHEAAWPRGSGAARRVERAASTPGATIWSGDLASPEQWAAVSDLKNCAKVSTATNLPDSEVFNVTDASFAKGHAIAFRMGPSGECYGHRTEVAQGNPYSSTKPDRRFYSGQEYNFAFQARLASSYPFDDSGGGGIWQEHVTANGKSPLGMGVARGTTAGAGKLIVYYYTAGGVFTEWIVGEARANVTYDFAVHLVARDTNTGSWQIYESEAGKPLVKIAEKTELATIRAEAPDFITAGLYPTSLQPGAEIRIGGFNVNPSLATAESNAWGSEVVEPPPVEELAPPHVPTGLALVSHGTSIGVSFTANPTADKVTAYNLYRAGRNYPGHAPGTPWATTTSLGFTQAYEVEPRMRLCYQLTAVNAKGESPRTPDVCVTA